MERKLRILLFTTCLLLQWHRLYGANKKKEEKTGREREPKEVCCFGDDDVLLRNVARGVNYLVIDGVFCPSFLEVLSRLTTAAHAAGLFTPELGSALPSREFSVATLQENRTLRLELMRAANIKGKKKAHRQFEAILSESWLECALRASQLVGFPLQPDWRRGGAGHEPATLSFFDGKPRSAVIHQHSGRVTVINVHLSSDFNDTGTAFYQTKALQTCSLDPEKQEELELHHSFVTDMDALLESHGHRDIGDDCVDSHTAACEESAALGRCQQNGTVRDDCPASCGLCWGVWPGPHLPRREDHTGTFEVLHVEDFRQNRMVIYDGSAHHSPYFTKASVQRLRLASDSTSGRLMMRRLLPQSSPFTAAAPRGKDEL